MTEINTIDAQTLAARLEQGATALFLLDVREENEYAHSNIDGATLVPLGQIPQRLAEIPRDVPIVAYCHHGRRSERALQYLATQGYGDLCNLTGGIDAWAVTVDPSMPRY